jgi:quinol monooxygenase YgiN
MAIGVIWNPPIDQEAYDAIAEKVFGSATEKGMRFHAAGEGDGAWRIIEVWDSREGLQRFIQEDLAAAAEEVSGGQAPTPEPEHIFDVHNQGP